MFRTILTHLEPRLPGLGTKALANLMWAVSAERGGMGREGGRGAGQLRRDRRWGSTGRHRMRHGPGWKAAWCLQADVGKMSREAVPGPSTSLGAFH